MSRVLEIVFIVHLYLLFLSSCFLKVFFFLGHVPIEYKYEKTCCHSASSGRPFVNAGVKNSQRSKIIIIPIVSGALGMIRLGKRAGGVGNQQTN